MQPPFTVEQFFNVLVAYNEAVWPAQIVLVVLALAAVGAAVRTGRGATRFGVGVLALLWLWTGVAYHLAQFTAINNAAWLFGSAFVVQGLLFGLAAWRGWLDLSIRGDVYGWVGGLFLVYALVVYPLINAAQGHAFMASPTFGAPCPATIFTFGLLLWSRGRVPGWLLVIPLLWSVVGGSATIFFGVWQDIGLAVAGVAGTAMLLVRNRRSERAEGPVEAVSPA